MFRTNRISEDTEDIYFILLQIFGNPAAKKIMNFLLSNRTYNIQLVGSSGVGKSSFTKRLSRNTFTPNYRAGAVVQQSIAFPTSVGKIVFNIRECRYTIYDPNLVGFVRDEWKNTDAFFVMASHQDKLPYEQCEKWIQTIRRVLQRDDVPIVYVDLKCDRRGRYNLQPNILNLCARYGNIPYVQVSSKDGTNIHGPFLALQDILRTSDRNIFADIPNIPITPLLLPPPPPPQPPQPPDQE
jgi:GTPase SAR1 family protein